VLFYACYCLVAVQTRPRTCTTSFKYIPLNLLHTSLCYTVHWHSVVAPLRGADWDTALHTPPWLSPSESAQMQLLVPAAVRGLGTATSALRQQLHQCLHAPLRPVWLASGLPVPAELQGAATAAAACVPVVCISASQVRSNSCSANSSSVLCRL
jgi:Rit1 N-terminal domain